MSTQNEVRNYVLDLVSRMLDETPAPSSVESGRRPVASSSDMEAHHEAEGLRDLAIVHAAIDLLRTEAQKDARRALHFIIGKIGKATQEPLCAQALIRCLGTEVDQYVLAQILDRLAEIRKPIGVPLAPIFGLLGHKHALVRRSAISALAHCEDPAAEQHLVRVYASSADTHDLVSASAALATSGSSSAVSALQQAALHPSEEVASSAIGTLTVLGSPALLPLFIDRLAHGGRVAHAAMAAIAVHGDERALPAVLARVEKLLRKKRRAHQVPRSELIAGLTFLWRYRAVAEVARLLAETLPSCEQSLYDDERAQLAELRAHQV